MALNALENCDGIARGQRHNRLFPRWLPGYFWSKLFSLAANVHRIYFYDFHIECLLYSPFDLVFRRGGCDLERVTALLLHEGALFGDHRAFENLR